MINVEFGIVKEWLEAMLDTASDIEFLEEHLRRLTNRMEQVSSPKLTDMPRNPSPQRDRMSEDIARKDTLQERIADKMAFLEASRVLLERLLECCCNRKERKVIQLHDIAGMDWSEIAPLIFDAEKLTGEEGTKCIDALYRYRRRGAQKIAKFLHEKDGDDGFPTLADIAERRIKNF